MEIKAEDFEVVSDTLNEKELKQQILQDQKETEECRNFHYREHEAKKNEQIVKRLKVQLSKCVVSPQEIFDKKEYSFRMIKQIFKKEFQEILEGEK